MIYTLNVVMCDTVKSAQKLWINEEKNYVLIAWHSLGDKVDKVDHGQISV